MTKSIKILVVLYFLVAELTAQTICQRNAVLLVCIIIIIVVVIIICYTDIRCTILFRAERCLIGGRVLSYQLIIRQLFVTLLNMFLVFYLSLCICEGTLLANNKTNELKNCPSGFLNGSRIRCE